MLGDPSTVEKTLPRAPKHESCLNFIKPVSRVMKPRENHIGFPCAGENLPACRENPSQGQVSVSVPPTGRPKREDPQNPFQELPRITAGKFRSKPRQYLKEAQLAVFRPSPENLDLPGHKLGPSLS